MVTEVAKSEFRFRGEVSYQQDMTSCVKLFVEGDDNPVWEGSRNIPNDPRSLVDAVFQDWLTRKSLSKFSKVRSRELRAALLLGQKERRSGVEWRNRTHRFLCLDREGERNSPIFVFTSDKSDIEERKRKDSERAERARVAAEERTRQVALGSKGNLIPADVMEQYRNATVIKFSARPFNSIEYRTVGFGSSWVGLQDLFPMLDIKPQDLRDIFRFKGINESVPEHVSGYEELGSLRLDDEEGFKALAVLLRKQIEIWREDGGTGEHYYLFSVSPN